MASHLDGIARSDVFALDADLEKSTRTGGFERPRRGLPSLVFDVEVNPGMRDEQVHFLDDALHGGPLRDIVIPVGMVRPRGHHGAHGGYRDKAQASDLHRGSP